MHPTFDIARGRVAPGPPLQPAEQHTIAGIHLEQGINTTDRVRRAWIIDEVSEISSQAFVRRRFTFLTYGPYLSVYRALHRSRRGPHLRRKSLHNPMFFKSPWQACKILQHRTCAQAQKVLAIGIRRRQGLRQVYRKCHIGMVAVSIIVIFRREKI